MNDLLWLDSPFNIAVRSIYGMNDLLWQDSPLILLYGVYTV